MCAFVFLQKCLPNTAICRARGEGGDNTPPPPPRGRSPIHFPGAGGPAPAVGSHSGGCRTAARARVVGGRKISASDEIGGGAHVRPPTCPARHVPRPSCRRGQQANGAPARRGRGAGLGRRERAWPGGRAGELAASMK